MRVTNNITTKQFLRNNNMALTNMLRSENRIETQRRFNRVSEDTINGGRAMIIRRQLRDLDIYKENLSSTKALFSAAEVNLISIAHDDYIKVEEKLVAATNGTWDQMELDIYAQELDEIAENMVFTLNNDFSERELFGGASNGPTPFQIQRVKIVDADDPSKVIFPPDYYKYFDNNDELRNGVDINDVPKTVTYNGYPLDFDVTADMICTDGSIIAANSKNKSYTITVFDENKKEWDSINPIEVPAESVNNAIEYKNNALLYPGSKPIYVDIGLGIKYKDNYEVDPQTALDVSMNGAEITGNGIDISGVPISGSVSGTSADLSAGYPAGTTGALELTVNGKTYNLSVDIGEALPAGGGPYDENTAASALTVALRKAYKNEAGVSLPEDISLSVSNGNFMIRSGATQIVVGTNAFGFATGEVTRTAAVDDDGIPIISSRYSKNLIQLTLDAAAALRRSDQSTTNAIIDRANTANSHILKQITILGTKQETIDFYLTKNEDYKFSLQERQNVVEGTDMEEEIVRYEAIKAAYDATLKIGSQILPHSIFDFI